MMKILLPFAMVVLSGCSHGFLRGPAGDGGPGSSQDATEYPILEKLRSSGQQLYGDTTKWMANWHAMDLEQTDLYSFPKLTGSTSINLKIQKVDPSKKKGFKKLGIFLAPNSSGNPTAELAYFNMAAILGWDEIMRPAARYQLGPKASQEFLALINKGPIKSDQQKNADNIKALIATGNPLQGCLKAEKDKTSQADDAMVDTSFGDNGGPNMTSPVIVSLQITNPAPVAGASVNLLRAGANNPGDPAYIGDALQLAVEYSVIMTLDSIFQQGDRYSGGNLGVRLDANGRAHMYSSDNGGAALDSDPSLVTLNLGWFSRYDRKTIDRLRVINKFLLNPRTGFMGYTDAALFVTDLGFYFEMDPATSAQLLQRNIQTGVLVCA
jgi:hypothetical protein